MCILKIRAPTRAPNIKKVVILVRMYLRSRWVIYEGCEPNQEAYIWYLA